MLVAAMGMVGNVLLHEFGVTEMLLLKDDGTIEETYLGSPWEQTIRQWAKELAST